jgi:hypothetical protein
MKLRMTDIATLQGRPVQFKCSTKAKRPVKKSIERNEGINNTDNYTSDTRVG